MNPIAVIPARGNSQRLPEKNLRRLGGKSLTQWAIEAAKRSGLFADRIDVTTDDDAVVRVARDLGVKVLPRHRETARADATLDHVIREVREQLHTRSPFYVLTPTSPFRNPETMRRAWTAYATNDDVGKVVSVRLCHDPPHWALTLVRGCVGRVTPVFPEAFDRTRTELPACVQQDGSHVIQGTNGGYTMAFEVDPYEGVDINTAEDLEWANYLLTTGRIPYLQHHKQT